MCCKTVAAFMWYCGDIHPHIHMKSAIETAVIFPLAHPRKTLPDFLFLFIFNFISLSVVRLVFDAFVQIMNE